MKIIYSLAGNHKNHLYLLVLILALSSCTIEKRRYQQSYNVEWNNHIELFANRSRNKIKNIPLQHADLAINNINGRIKEAFYNKKSNPFTKQGGNSATYNGFQNIKNKRLEKIISKILDKQALKCNLESNSMLCDSRNLNASTFGNNFSILSQQTYNNRNIQKSVNTHKNKYNNITKRKRGFGFGNLSAQNIFFLISTLISILTILIYLLIIFSIV